MDSEQEFKCVFCSETFSHKEDFQVHFRKHGDPNFNQKKPKERSQDEMDVLPEKLKDQAEIVECDVCTDVFSSISKAITHKHKVHPDHDTKYFCPWCGKLFTMKHLYNKHLQASHSDMVKTNENFHCNTCDVDFNRPAAMFYHNKFFHRQEELPTLGHSKKLKMIQEEAIQIYYCPFCGEEYDNKVNLNKHMTEDHCGENQSPNDVFRCPLCDAIFYYLDAYELHLTYHSIGDMYTERNEMIDEITDFSLETVEPLQEKVESVEPMNEEESAAVGIEQLLEFTMNDAPDNRKPKKHKKHKKSKKAAITLDEFLNMNKDVFGEGIDFQGIEEVPTQVVAKRLKAKKAVPASKFMSSDLAKLKRQGIVVKKQSTKIGKPLMMNKGALPKTAINMQKKLIPKTQIKSNTLTSTDDVLSKLLNQGNQIKIVKKTNQDSEEHIQEKKDALEEENLSDKNKESENDESKDLDSDINKTEENINNSEENMEIVSPKTKDDKIKSEAASPNPESPSIIGNNQDMDNLQNCKEASIDSSKIYSEIKSDENPALSEKATDLTDNLNIFQNNSNIAIKLCKQNPSTAKSSNVDSEEEESADHIKSDTHEKTEKNTASASEKSSIDALKHLSHLITIKPVNSIKLAPSSEESKSENNIKKVEVAKASDISQNNSPKTSETAHFTSLKNLSGITIKSTSQSRLNLSKINQLQNEGNDQDDHETDEEWNESKNDGNTMNKMNADKFAHILRSPQLNVQTKHATKTMQKESPKGSNNNENSQSSADLLKHLKNVTAKPVNVNSQKILTPQSSPSFTKKGNIAKTSLQKEVTEDGIEIFSIDDSDSDEAYSSNPTNNTTVKNEGKTEANKSTDSLKNVTRSINQQCKLVNKEVERHSDEALHDEDEDWGDSCDKKDTNINSLNSKFNSPKPNQKNAVFNVLKNLSKNITVKSRNSSPSQSVPSQDHNSKDSHLETNEGDSDSDSPLSQIKITEMENMSDDEFSEEQAETNIPQGNIKVQHPDDSQSENENEPVDEDFDDMSDIESHIAAAKVQNDNFHSNPSSLNNLKNLRKDLTIKSSNNKTSINSQPESSSPSEEIPSFAKNLSNQISIKQFKKHENVNPKVVEQSAARPVSQPSVNQNKIAHSSNEVNTFNKEVKTVKTFQTQTKTVIQEITTTVTKTIKTVNQTMKQEVRNMAQSNSAPMMAQKVHGMNVNFPSQKNFQGVKVRQSVPNVRPKIRGQAPQTVRPAICAPPQGIRPASYAPNQIRASNQLVPVRPALNRVSGPRSRMPNVTNLRASTSGQQRPQIGRPVKVSPGVVLDSPKKAAESTGHFSCFKKPKESLIPVPDFSGMNKHDGESSAQFSSAMHMCKSNFSSTTKVVKGNSLVTSTQMKSEMSTSSQQLSKLRGVSGLSVVKTSQSQAKQAQVEEKSEISASKRNALEAIQRLQNQGLLIKKPRLDVNEDSDHSQPGSEDMRHDSDEEFDE